MHTTEISDEEWLAWRGYRRLAALITGRIARDISEATGLSDQDFMILMELSKSPHAELLQRELQEYIEWDKSRLSHQLSRMSSRGLVQRNRKSSSGISVGITDAGRLLLDKARPVHAASVRRHFLDLLTPDDLPELIAINERLRQSGGNFKA
ncbi:MarR family winged helix-turn-helix transcriptional regulator [Pantoea sp. Lij88]|jgi:DNA-binding MarR family transcriptional regulator|uniref:MarR family winged helix-turn-helix transcriptional regulator n=1 Tax=Pantoea sp. Lij88 TaxID=3028622 RepID=UPI0024B966CE|nr:MarR family winged helix-turn-helix transcriptional regulator [Pantoea sp. Lij88]WHQ73309.1 MarR family winged helix-turn-helix transcriptional regulator [Pantoea sp. Lij88]